jgi:hypothetical protein
MNNNAYQEVDKIIGILFVGAGLVPALGWAKPQGLPLHTENAL